MDNKSEAFKRVIYAKRSQYKSKKFTPPKLLWIWEDNFKEMELREIDKDKV